MLEAQYEGFRRKFGRDPGPHDPIFFDPIADQPRFRTETQLKEMTDMMYHLILDAGIDPALAYAYRKTGRLLTKENRKYLTRAELSEWNDAIEEYRSNNGSAQ